MKLTVLVDNNTIIDRYLLGEPALSFYIECGGKKILFDTGFTDVAVRNARELKIDLLDLDFVVLSHGHRDHSMGLVHLISLHRSAIRSKRQVKRPALIAHGAAFHKKMKDGGVSIGMDISQKELLRYFDLNLTDCPYWITKNLVFLGEIERNFRFEGTSFSGKCRSRNGFIEDHLEDDSALAFVSKNGSVVISGCAHSGICNTVEYAKKVCGTKRVAHVIGGFHLLKPGKRQLDGTLKYLKAQKLRSISPCHCVDLASKIALSNITKVNDVGVGLKMEFA